jgi:hypothetical protein
VIISTSIKGYSNLAIIKSNDIIFYRLTNPLSVQNGKTSENIRTFSDETTSTETATPKKKNSKS